LQGLLPNILKTLRKKSDKQDDLAQTKIFSKTSVDEELLKKLEKTLAIDTKNAKIIIDKNLGAGMIIKSGGLVVDASLETMLEKAIAKII
jgi:F0F1-type ATP synthase delta subunit